MSPYTPISLESFGIGIPGTMLSPYLSDQSMQQQWKMRINPPVHTECMQFPNAESDLTKQSVLEQMEETSMTLHHDNSYWLWMQDRNFQNDVQVASYPYGSAPILSLANAQYSSFECGHEQVDQNSLYFELPDAVGAGLDGYSSSQRGYRFGCAR